MTTIEKILSPITVSSFLSEYWDQKSLHLPGVDEKGALLGLQVSEAESFLKRSAREGEDVCLMDTGENTGDKGSLGSSVLLRLRDLAVTMKFGVDPKRAPHVAELAQSMRDEFGAVGEFSFTGVVSGAGSGAVAHVDDVSVLVIQIEGVKDWQFGRTPAARFPGESFTEATIDTYIEDRPLREAPQGFDEGAIDRRYMTPGDILYMPAGTWHRACALTTSFHISIYHEAPSFLDLLFATLQRKAGASSHVFSRPGPAIDGRAMRGSKLPEAVESALSTGLSGFRDLLRGVTAEELLAVWDEWLDKPRSKVS